MFAWPACMKRILPIHVLSVAYRKPPPLAPKHADYTMYLPRKRNVNSELHTLLFTLRNDLLTACNWFSLAPLKHKVNSAPCRVAVKWMLLNDWETIQGGNIRRVFTENIVSLSNCFIEFHIGRKYFRFFFFSV